MVWPRQPATGQKRSEKVLNICLDCLTSFPLLDLYKFAIFGTELNRVTLLLLLTILPIHGPLWVLHCTAKFQGPLGMRMDV